MILRQWKNHSSPPKTEKMNPRKKAAIKPLPPVPVDTQSFAAIAAARCTDLEALLRIRNYEMTECRNKFLFLYRTQAAVCMTPQEVKKRLERLNRSLSQPLPKAELANLQANTYRHYKWHDHTITRFLDITPQEIAQLQIIGHRPKESKAASAKRHREKRRDASGKLTTATTREKRNQKIIKAAAQGKSVAVLCKTYKLNKSQVYVILSDAKNKAA
ncbi:MAG: hypothetical protein H6Q60_824 [Oscillospiraceae bacterium]|nr:hypothetical protein [Oscillospiraceae bacterium]